MRITRHWRLLAPVLALAGMLLIPTATIVHADETVTVIENMPSNCSRGSDGTITCDGYSVTEFCSLFGSNHEDFCYGGSSSSGGGSSSSGSSSNRGTPSSPKLNSNYKQPDPPYCMSCERQRERDRPRRNCVQQCQDEFYECEGGKEMSEARDRFGGAFDDGDVTRLGCGIESALCLRRCPSASLWSPAQQDRFVVETIRSFPDGSNFPGLI